MKNKGSVGHAHVLEEVANLTSAHISLARTHDHTQLPGRTGTVALKGAGRGDVGRYVQKRVQSLWSVKI